MGGTARRVVQPGPVSRTRIESLEGDGVAIDLALTPGLTLLDALAGPLAGAGVAGAGVRLEGVELSPMAYVVPAPAPTREHVAFYSETYRPEGPVTIEAANVTYGRRDGRPFIHAHAVWRDAEGRIGGGHLLPTECVVSRAGRARAWGLTGVAMRADFDPETNFTLFHPVGVESPATGSGPRTVLAALRPGEDLHLGIATVARRHGIRDGIVRSAVGSLVQARFADGRVIEDIGTEILAFDGRVSTDGGDTTVGLDLGVVDSGGNVHRGRLAVGDNPVLIILELVLEAVG